MQIKTGVTARPAVGQIVCGDAWAITTFTQGTMLCLADGLGHGPEAQVAAVAACRYAEAHAADPLESMLHGMNGALVGLRGAAVSVLVLEPGARRAVRRGAGRRWGGD